MSALHIAALEGHRGLVEALLAAGALPLPPAATVPRVYAALPLSPATCHVVACCHALVGATRTLCDSSGATAAENKVFLVGGSIPEKENGKVSCISCNQRLLKFLSVFLAFRLLPV